MAAKALHAVCFAVADRLQQLMQIFKHNATERGMHLRKQQERARHMHLTIRYDANHSQTPGIVQALHTAAGN